MSRFLLLVESLLLGVPFFSRAYIPESYCDRTLLNIEIRDIRKWWMGTSMKVFSLCSTIPPVSILLSNSETLAGEMALWAIILKNKLYPIYIYRHAWWKYMHFINVNAIKSTFNILSKSTENIIAKCCNVRVSDCSIGMSTSDFRVSRAIRAMRKGERKTLVENWIYTFGEMISIPTCCVAKDTKFSLIQRLARANDVRSCVDQCLARAISGRLYIYIYSMRYSL